MIAKLKGAILTVDEIILKSGRINKYE